MTKASRQMGKRDHDGVVGGFPGQLSEERDVVRGDLVHQAIAIFQDEAVQENQALDFFRDGFGDFGNDGAAEAVADEDKVGERVGGDVINDGLGGLGVVDEFVDAFSTAGDGGGEGVWPSLSS